MWFGGIKLVVGLCALRYAQLPNSNYFVQVYFLRFEFYAKSAWHRRILHMVVIPCFTRQLLKNIE
jgi:hypothetical protein